MYAFCTYCSASKNSEEGDIPAIRRYHSLRIEAVYAAATSLGLDFYILSGKYGLLAPDYLIPWYDHLLRPEEVSNLVKRVAKQLVDYQVAGLVYFTKSLAQERAVIPYHNTIIAACSEAKRPFTMVELNDECFGD